MKRYHALSGDTLDWAKAADAAPLLPTTSLDDLQQAVHLVEPDGRTCRGAHAMFTIMDRIGLRTWPLVLYRYVPPVRLACDAVYSLVANHRSGANRLSSLLFGRVETPSTLLLTRRIFLRLLGLVFIAAFVSFGQQSLGLIGPQGIKPAEVLVEVARENGVNWWQMPTFQMFAHVDGPSSEGIITLTWVIGAIAGGLMTLGLLPLLGAVVAWLCYLSLVTTSDVFLQYQWDALLLETGVLAVLWSPLTWRLNSVRVRRPSRLVHWLIVLLLIRLIFFGGLAKLQSGDPAWTDCTALAYHFWTQPLPWWSAWYVQQLPDVLLQVACAIMFLIELGAPLLLLLPRVPRSIGALAIILLMLGVIATGNYGFFNWLTIVLCLAMFDDATLLRLWPKVVRSTIRVGIRPVSEGMWKWSRSLIGVCLLSLVLSTVWMQTFNTMKPVWMKSWQRTFSRWHLVSHYGLFAVMTTTRPEIIIEAQARDGFWKPYVFKWKPGPLDRAPAFHQPGMPRLDWQMWFDALSYERVFEAGMLSRSPNRMRFTGREVLPALLRRLAVSDSIVLTLLKSSPLEPDELPQALRWHLDQYRFTTPTEFSQSGNWWTRTRIFSSPPMSFALP
jgi:predicted DCC family thiol-disulfide oxidoreductase YuxK